MARWDNAWHRRFNTALGQALALPTPEQRAARRALGQDPVAFALIYLRDHLRGRPTKLPDGTETPGHVSFAECHYEWARIALGWRDPDPAIEPQSDRHGIIAPRETGKSTWWYLILPLWAAA
jgi:hypothetical protein